ncbi:hypothetical protein [Sinomicrobium sp. M5D2P9]
MLITFLFGIFIVLALHIAAPIKENHKHTGFERVFAPEGVLQPIDTLNLGKHGYYFAGTDADRVFLGNWKSIGYVLELNSKNLKDSAYHIIKADNLKYRSLEVKVDIPYFYLIDGNMPFIYRGNISNWVASPYLENINSTFTHAQPISDSSFALIRVNNNFKGTFCKITKGKNGPEVYPGLLETQEEDNIFNTDGMLHFDKKMEQLIYVYFYRNQYLCIDTNLQLKHTSKTIDTINKVKISVDKISSENSMTMSSPPLRVNKKNSISNGLLFNNSNILAGNENVKNFESASVIDVYRLKDGSYQFSFYIQPYEKKKAEAFMVLENNTILVLYGHDMVSYSYYPI